MKRPSKDTRVILDVVGDACKNKLSLNQAAVARIQSNKVWLRLRRKQIRQTTNPRLRKWLEDGCTRLLNDNKRVKRLIKTYASWRP